MDKELETFYKSSSKDKFRLFSDEELMRWVNENLEQIETVLLYIQRDTSRLAHNEDQGVALNSFMLAQSQILNRIYEMGEAGRKQKPNKH